MKAGIIVAMGKEMDLLLPLLEGHATTTINDYTFHTGRIDGRSVVAVQCGIGKVNAAVATLTLIENFHVGIVINTGVAGGTGHGADILDVVVADHVAYHDVWCGPGTEPGQAAGCPRFFQAPLSGEAIDAIGGVKRGLIASGDIFVSRPEDVERILALYPEAMAVDMESGAIAQVCHIKDVPFLAVRVVSDTPGKADNVAQYENFWTAAPQSTFDALQRILKSL